MIPAILWWNKIVTTLQIPQAAYRAVSNEHTENPGINYEVNYLRGARQLQLAIAACRKTSGTGILVEDDWTWEEQRRMAEEEGIFTEPAGATGGSGGGSVTVIEQQGPAAPRTNGAPGPRSQVLRFPCTGGVMETLWSA